MISPKGKKRHRTNIYHMTHHIETKSHIPWQQKRKQVYAIIEKNIFLIWSYLERLNRILGNFQDQSFSVLALWNYSISSSLILDKKAKYFTHSKIKSSLRNLRHVICAIDRNKGGMKFFVVICITWHKRKGVTATVSIGWSINVKTIYQYMSNTFYSNTINPNPDFTTLSLF